MTDFVVAIFCDYLELAEEFRVRGIGTFELGEFLVEVGYSFVVYPMEEQVSKGRTGQ